MAARKMNDKMLARLFALEFANHPVEIITGNIAPRCEGKYWYFTTLGGEYIRYPNAYNWPKVYHNSTKHVVVGREWLRRHRGGWKYDSNVGAWYNRRELKVFDMAGKSVRVQRMRAWGDYGTLFIINGKYKLYANDFDAAFAKYQASLER